MIHSTTPHKEHKIKNPIIINLENLQILRKKGILKKDLL